MNRSRQTFVFKVTLRHTKPTIWRRIEVPATYTFWDLHVAIQDAMGWLDYHLHQFHLEDRSTGTIADIGIPDPDPFAGDQLPLSSWTVPLTADLTDPAVRIEYTYDFGDNWEHRVVLETSGIRDDRLAYPRCLAGARACPPEDCGGPHAYIELLQAIADPERPGAAELRRWVGKSFNPAAFDAAVVKFSDPKVRWRTAFGASQRRCWLPRMHPPWGLRHSRVNRFHSAPFPSSAGRAYLLWCWQAPEDCQCR